MFDASRKKDGTIRLSSDSELIREEDHEAIDVNEASDSHPLLGAEEEYRHDNDNSSNSSSDKEAARKQSRAQLLNMLSMIIVDIALPVTLFYISRNFVPDLYALLISGIPPFLSVIIKFATRRRVDIVGFIVVVSYVVSAVISLVSGDARAALLRDSAVTCSVGLLFFTSLLPIKTRWVEVRPLTFMVTQQMYADAPPMTWVDAAGEKHTMQLTDWMWDMVGGFARRYHYGLSGGWGFFLMLEVLIRVFLVLGTTLPVERIYLYGTIVGITVVVFMISCSIVGGIQVKRYCLEWVKQNDHSGQY